MKANIGISQKNLSLIAGMLSTILADAEVLYMKTRKFHWNVSGNSFMELHKSIIKRLNTQLMKLQNG